VNRAIIGFHQDSEGHWVADLDCGHAQHTRHQPPQSERPWVLSEAGRSQRLGSPLDCLRCDRRELPAGFVAYSRTPDFDAASTPAALRSRHDTKPGVWARIHVLAGQLRYRTHAPFHDETLLGAGDVGVVLPEVEHEVEPLGEVSFHVEFYRRGDSG